MGLIPRIFSRNVIKCHRMSKKPSKINGLSHFYNPHLWHCLLLHFIP